MKKGAVSVCVAAILLAACGASGASPQSNAPIPSTLTQRGPELAQSGSRRAFSGAYAGSYTYQACNPIHGAGTFIFTGAGKVAFLGESNESGTMMRGIKVMGSDRGCRPLWGGDDTLQSSKNPSNSISMKLFEQHPVSFESPCGHKFRYEVTGGTGEFASATGKGVVAFQCIGDSQYSDEWSGQISF